MKIIVTLIFLFVSTFFLTSYADTELENISLIKVAHILDSISTMINAAEAQSDPLARVQFNYQTLRDDISLIHQGIMQKLDFPTIEPMVVHPLKDDFLK